MDYDFEVNLLSAKFLNSYPDTLYPELMHKQGRPYSCLLIDTHQDYLICIPEELGTVLFSYFVEDEKKEPSLFLQFFKHPMGTT